MRHRKRSRPLLTEFLRSSVFLVALYLWFFQLVELIDDLVPALSGPIFFLLASVPLACIRYRVFRPTLLLYLKHTKAVSKNSVLKHILFCAIRLMPFATEAMLLFFSSNLFLQALPDSRLVFLPRAWNFLGSSVFTTSQLQKWFKQWSLGLMQVVMAALGSAFLLSVKEPPKDHAPTGVTALERYWTARRRGRGPVVVLDLALSMLFCSLVVLELMRFLSIPPSTMSMFGGVGTVALGFASQRVMGNLVAGLLLLVTQPFVAGDEIQTGSRRGIVRGVGWNATVVEASDGAVVIIPNEAIVKAETTNLSRSEFRIVRLDIPVLLPRAEVGARALGEVKQALARHVSLQNNFIAEPRVFFNYPFDTRSPQPVFSIEACVDVQRTIDIDGMKSTMLLVAVDVLHDMGVTVKGASHASPTLPALSPAANGAPLPPPPVPLTAPPLSPTAAPATAQHDPFSPVPSVGLAPA